ncbi:hypothetical protein T4B_276 [Trichinella pseudospiralis]|uniref:Uncharacterized protein n=1 Tax=Trichinella pseudospiralis TaxID=6337 RepID=A0A0V1GJD9_TRIPS|nr:hypothetical protein T4B_8454 [Trichinella pseudospiralis]KRY98388.1 hypothetical protein T4B_276 [Trichinella pseudospiralis]
MAYINGNADMLNGQHHERSIKSGLSEIEILVKMNSYLIST